jgi:hypothetical protein
VDVRTRRADSALRLDLIDNMLVLLCCRDGYVYLKGAENLVQRVGLAPNLTGPLYPISAAYGFSIDEPVSTTSTAWTNIIKKLLSRCYPMRGRPDFLKHLKVH